MVVGVSPAGLQGGHFYKYRGLTSCSCSPEQCRHSYPALSPGYQHQTRLKNLRLDDSEEEEGVGNETIIDVITL